MAEAQNLTELAETALDTHIGPKGGPLDSGVTLSQVRLRTILNLRGNAEGKAFVDGVKSALGVALPLEPNSVSSADGTYILWLGPDEWLVVSDKDVDELQAALQAVIADIHYSAVDLTDNYEVIEISGAKARWVLAKGWAVDLHPSKFKAGSCAQSVISHAAVILHQISDEPGYQLYVRPSFAPYLWDWLVDASADVGYRIG